MPSVNLRHSSLASSSLAQVIIDLNIDIVLVQEPYALPCIPPVVANLASAPFAIIGADVNARSRLWNSTSNDKRGSDLESLLVCSRLNIVNRSLTELNFVPAGTSFVDLTLAGDQISVLHWLFLSIPSLSDHPYIYFEINHGNFDRPNKNSYRPSVPSLPRINRDLYTTELAKSLGRPPIPIHVESSEAVEAQIASLVSAISVCALAARVPTPRLVKSSTNMVWWSKDLSALRSSNSISLQSLVET
ncbi:hypothetical protein GHT06_007657 [Daphnia sinensis]|uniref:Endonuclease/exonuclease/phosphatase domain-containing protein n=1 Tax=Daphnia sinensis TaxID=1820382 RepID=A0AAD5PMQ1_9CRUS|nr:hypothetical protein GHT06_007657 [Daphnia sinensis]